MARNIFRVTATQVVTSEANPYGLFSTMSGYPIDFDSSKDPYNGDVDLCLNAAKGEYFDRLGKNYKDTNKNRVMKTVTLETVNGQQLLHESIGYLPEPTEKKDESDDDSDE